MDVVVLNPSPDAGPPAPSGWDRFKSAMSRATRMVRDALVWAWPYLATVLSLLIRFGMDFGGWMLRQFKSAPDSIKMSLDGPEIVRTFTAPTLATLGVWLLSLAVHAALTAATTWATMSPSGLIAVWLIHFFVWGVKRFFHGTDLLRSDPPNGPRLAA